MKKILVIDDDQFFCKTLEAALPAGKYAFVSAEDGEVGLEKLRSEKPDLVILDLMLPKLDGTAFLKNFRNQPTCPRCRFWFPPIFPVLKNKRCNDYGCYRLCHKIR